MNSVTNRRRSFTAMLAAAMKRRHAPESNGYVSEIAKSARLNRSWGEAPA